VADQFPVVCVGGRHYTMSLRMMKAVWYYPLILLLGQRSYVCGPICQAQRSFAARFCERGARAFRGYEAAYPFAVVRGENANPDAF
jgi:hypothetical protein